MESDAIGMSARRASIDMLRGALVIGVIAGHCAELVARGSFLAWIGTGIRMPLFLGLCGFCSEWSGREPSRWRSCCAAGGRGSSFRG
ncbi:hypothetical protein MOP88_05215 [Sphingomonas sp. WKB10]|nr:hypothetical protein [Sphingomonas sp. WKB10]